MNPKVLKTENDYETALARVAVLMDASPDSSEADELKLWSILVERYEQENFPIDDPDPAEAIRFCMKQEILRPKDLEPYLNGINGFRTCTPAYS